MIVGAIGLLWGGISLLSGFLGAQTQFLLGSALGVLLLWPWTEITAIVIAGFLMVTG
jgi:hypothetical protein